MNKVHVETGLGSISGQQTDGISSFLGVPYAKAPIGPLRFRAPVPVEPWSGLLDASQYGPIASQSDGILRDVLGRQDRPQSEDCLTLNVWTPDVDGQYPVMFFIHGGAFINGSAWSGNYVGTQLAARGVVVVTINYRLGALGFLHLSQLAGELYPESGNCGLLDQVCALEWVRDQIKAFGGDPDRLTIFGESAGAVSTKTLLGMPTAKGLFQQAILQSGTAADIHKPEEATAISETFLKILGITVSDIEKLQEVPVEKVLSAQRQILGGIPTGFGGAFQPVVDGMVVPALPQSAIADGKAGDIRVMAGTNQDEVGLWMAFDPQFQLEEAELLSRLAAILPTGIDPGPALEVYRREMPDAMPTQHWRRLLSDAIFRLPSIGFLEAQRKYQSDIYMYLFTWASPEFDGRLGSCHGLELPFVFDTLNSPDNLSLTGEVTAEMRNLAEKMADAWVAFASNGNPGWESYTAESRSTMMFGDRCELVQNPHDPQLRALLATLMLHKAAS